MRVLIVEDETAACDNLRAILRQIDPDIRVERCTESIRQTLQWLQHNPLPDLIFMDIHLSDGSAFSIFDSITVETPIIFTTAYDEYAIEAFRVNSIDYILKPIDAAKVERALGKFRRLSGADKQQYIQQLSLLPDPGKHMEKILVTVADKLIPVAVKDVACFYTTDSNTRIILKNGSWYPYNKTLDNIIQRLDGACFFRANKQFIVNKEAVRNLTIWFDNRLLVTLETDVPERIYVSKNRASEFKKWITF
ncbi:MAG: LytTR family DNA-binding domain-containing protein [Tannerellaceae bacterium]|nr:LytTR family DNA-binding domain-containing protein [Tannerellaceae bacterium]MCD8264242.1 LytTR family DNA-binding domain-containing protein [Tannerellaceae bacterium]